MMMGLVRAAALALPALSAVLGPAWGQAAYPDRPLRFVIAFGPGGVGDTTSRLVAEKLGDKLGQRVVVGLASAGPCAVGAGASECVGRSYSPRSRSWRLICGRHALRLGLLHRGLIRLWLRADG